MTGLLAIMLEKHRDWAGPVDGLCLNMVIADDFGQQVIRFSAEWKEGGKIHRCLSPIIIPKDASFPALVAGLVDLERLIQNKRERKSMFSDQK
jgi:hypothetical protein